MTTTAVPNTATVPRDSITTERAGQAPAGRTLAVLRIFLGFVFLWAFLDKTFGLGYSTASAKAWINGGSPTKGFLSSVDVGPFQSLFHTMAGTWYANWLFMAAMLGIGIALILGIGMRIAAGAGVLVMAMMWLAEFPLDRTAADGKPSGSSNPVTDYHLIYAVGVVALALTYAGHTWGLGRQWAKLPFVQQHRWLI
jgi:thiosulfate dehydrogenase [quinone] large subunit